MFRYLFYVGSRLFFLLVLVPALYVACLVGLAQLGFPVRRLEVWGLAVVAGSLVLVLLSLVGWVFWKLRGSPAPAPPPQLPGWAKAMVVAGIGAVGVVLVASASLVGGTWLATMAWWQLPGGKGELGRLVLTRGGASGGLNYTLDFNPRNHPAVAPVTAGELYGESFGVRGYRVRFGAPASEVFGRIGLVDRVWPAEIWGKVDSTAQPIRAGTLCGEPGVLAARLLTVLEFLPGVTVEKLETALVTPGAKAEIVLRMAGDKLVLEIAGAGGPEPEPEPEPVPVPAPEPGLAPTAAPTAAPGPGPTAPTGAPGPTGGPRPMATAIPGGTGPAGRPKVGFEGTYAGDPLEGLE